MINFKKTALKITLTLPLLVSGNVFGAEKINIHIKNNTNLQDLSTIEDAVKSIKLLKYQENIVKGIDKIDIAININEEPKESTSNYDRKNCEININYTKNLRPLVFSNFSTDITVATLHEIAHCLLGKEIIFKGFKWNEKLDLSPQEINILSEKNREKSEKAFSTLKERDCSENKKCTPNEVFTIFPPHLAYHEIFADLWALAKLKDISCNAGIRAFDELESYRLKQFVNNPKVLHQSFLATYYLRDNFECEKKFDFHELNFYTQKGFIDYLSNPD